ncbi:DoxX family protein [Lacisediminihabitans sp.]|jgi:hypothetical protein|uniref:DoxX family protein n=1 Tax=Lacisediminihabitans sp. TaxID=2787631 RepID=UPI002F957992
MTVALWITSALLTMIYLLAGVMKVASSKEAVQPQMAYVEDFAAGQVKAIGAVELLGALGVILPLATGIAPVLTGVAAVGLAVVQVAALVVHVRRGEKSLPVNIALLLLAVAVAALRFATL